MEGVDRIGRFRVCGAPPLVPCGCPDYVALRDHYAAHPEARHRAWFGLTSPSGLLKAWTMTGRPFDEFAALIPIKNDPEQAAAFLADVLPAIERRIATLAAAPTIDGRGVGVEKAAVLLALLNELVDGDPLAPFRRDPVPAPA